MAYGAVNVPGVTGAELEAVRKIAQVGQRDRRESAGGHHGNDDQNQRGSLAERQLDLYGQRTVSELEQL